MRFVIEVADELLRGAPGGAPAETGATTPQRAPLSGGSAVDGALPGAAALTETLSAGPAEGGGVPASLGDAVAALDGGAAPD